jgi:hypothetical protein
MAQHQSLLEFKRGRYLKVALLACAAALFAYGYPELLSSGVSGPLSAFVKPYTRSYGGTWLGYTLGTIAALLIVWLMLLGIRKRRYGSRLGSVQGWASAHVYLGASLIVIATLHCAFEFGWNIHTLAYALMMLVIVSGFFGVYSYLRFPEDMTANLAGETLETMLLKVADLETKCKRIALDLPDEVNALFMKASAAAAERTALRGSLRRQLAGVDTAHPMRVARDQLLKMGTRFTGEQAKVLEQLVVEMSRIVALTDRIRRDLQIRALMQAWLYFHVPLSFALLAALIAHVVSVFYFW